MEKYTAQRRIVKSPPELWAEVSSEDLLGRHLAPFGDVRITRTEPETTVAWEGDRASGTVALEPAGWGTNVVLTATPLQPAAASGTAVGADAPPAREKDLRAADPPPPPPTHPEAAGPPPPPTHTAAAHPPPPPATHTATAHPPPPPATHTATAHPPPPPATHTEAAHAPAVPVALPTPQPARPQPPAHAVAPAADEPRSGFFARILRRRGHERAPSPRVSSQPAPGPEPTPPDPDPAPTLVAPEPAPAPAADRARLDAAGTAAVLTDVLDDLAAAHHRPFSRD